MKALLLDVVFLKMVVSKANHSYTFTMVKKPIAMLLLFIIIPCLYADTSDVSYHWKYLESILGYDAYMTSILNAQPITESERLFGKLQQEIENCDISEDLKILAKARSAIALGRRYAELNENHTTKSLAMIATVELLLTSAHDVHASSIMIDTLGVHLESLRYLATGKLSHGLGTARAIDRLYKENPNDISSIMLKADKLLYAPAIGGGNPKEALVLFSKAWNSIQSLSVCTWDRFTIIGGLGSALHKAKDTRALDYITYARTLYTGDPVINDLYDMLVGKE